MNQFSILEMGTQCRVAIVDVSETHALKEENDCTNCISIFATIKKH